MRRPAPVEVGRQGRRGGLRCDPLRRSVLRWVHWYIGYCRPRSGRIPHPPDAAGLAASPAAEAPRPAGRAAGRHRAASGLVVETLLAAGHPVVPIHPNIVKACRPRYRAAAAKSDPGDAYMLADILRTDGHRFAPLDPGLRRDQGAARPGPRPRRPRRHPRRPRQPAQEPARGLLARRRPHLRRRRRPDRARLPRPLPDAGSARRLGRKRLAAFLAQHRYCGRRSPEELLARLRAAPRGLAIAK